MPRDANGNYTLPAGNPVVSGTTIDTTWANPTMQDIGNELTNSLSRDGEGGMLVPFKFADGAVATPAMTWTNEETTGIYRAGTNDMRVSVGAVDKFRWTASSVEIWNSVDLIWETVATNAEAYLPLTGGTLTGDGPVLITKEETNGLGAYHRFSNLNGTTIGSVGYIGVDGMSLKGNFSLLLESDVINLDAPTTNINSNSATNIGGQNVNVEGDINLEDVSSVRNDINFRNAAGGGSIRGKLIADYATGVISFHKYVGAVGAETLSSGIQLGTDEINLNAPLINAGGVIKNTVSSGVVLEALAGETLVFSDASISVFGASTKPTRIDSSTLLSRALDGFNNISATTEINLDAPIVNVNGVPISTLITSVATVVNDLPKSGAKQINGLATFAIVFATPYPDANYSIGVTPIEGGGIIPNLTLKTATGFSITNANATPVNYNWITTRYNDV